MNSSLPVTLGVNLRQAREARGLSQEEFAVVLGIHRTYVGALERGERNVTLKTLEQIASALSLDPIQLLTGA